MGFRVQGPGFRGHSPTKVRLNSVDKLRPCSEVTQVKEDDDAGAGGVMIVLMTVGGGRDVW